MTCKKLLSGLPLPPKWGIGKHYVSSEFASAFQFEKLLLPERKVVEVMMSLSLVFSSVTVVLNIQNVFKPW